MKIFIVILEEIGEETIKPHNNNTNIKKLFNLIPSATAPLTIEAAVAQNTIWKNQSDPEE